MTELLRGGELKGASDLFQAVAASYRRAVDAIGQTAAPATVQVEAEPVATRPAPAAHDAKPDLDFATICDRSYAPMVVIDPRERSVEYANLAARELFSIKEDVPSSSHCWSVLRGQDGPCLKCPLDGELKQGCSLTVSQYLEALGTDVSIEYAMIQSGGRQLAQCSLCGDEKTQAAFAEMQSKQAAASVRSNLLSRVTHDMRTPMGTILGLSYLIADKEDIDDIKADVRQIASAGKYLLDLINDTLDAEKLNNGLQRLHVEVASEEDVVKNAYGIVSQSIVDKGIAFSIDNQAPWKRVLVDAQRLEQIFVNILGNAVKFTPRNGSIGITHKRLKDEGGLITDSFSFSDTGCGMEPEFIEHMLEPFAQENETATTETKGTGLGLFLVKQTLDLMGGEISATSVKGKGSTFTVTLQLPVAAMGDEASGKRPFSIDDYDLSGCRILLFEDHPINASITIGLVSKIGCSVVHAENGRIGLEIFEKSKPGDFDLILMDIRMPLMDGIETTRAIRALDRPDAASIPIVALSANAFESDIEESAKAGMNCHLSKPIDPVQLFRTLAEVLPKYKKHSESFPKVLFVDDEPTNVALLDVSLRDFYRILVAKSAEEALELLEANPDIIAIITDLQMPGMGGVKLIQAIRSQRKYDNIAILANTQYGGPEQEEDLLRIGADDFIYKPTTSHIVQIRLLNTLRRRG